MAPQRSKPTMKDVAIEAGVSKALVSLVYRTPDKVSPERLARVHEAAQRLGFRPNWAASSLSARASSFTAILISNLHNPVFGTVVDSARAELDKAGRYGLMSSAVIPGSDGVYRADHRIVNALEDLNAEASSWWGLCPTGRCCETFILIGGWWWRWLPSMSFPAPCLCVRTMWKACAT